MAPQSLFLWLLAAPFALWVAVVLVLWVGEVIQGLRAT